MLGDFKFCSRFLCLLYSSLCFRYVGCRHVPVLGGPAFALVLLKKNDQEGVL